MTTQDTALPADLREEIKACAAKPRGDSYLIAMLQKAQNAIGYLSREHMDEISQLMQIPAARVTGVATFYHFFTFEKRGKVHITICMGTACFVRGADKVLQRLKDLLHTQEGKTTEDGQFSIECARCLGACALAPVVVVNDKVYGNVTPDEVEGILASHGYEKEA